MAKTNGGKSDISKLPLIRKIRSVDEKVADLIEERVDIEEGSKFGETMDLLMQTYAIPDGCDVEKLYDRLKWSNNKLALHYQSQHHIMMGTVATLERTDISQEERIKATGDFDREYNEFLKIEAKVRIELSKNTGNEQYQNNFAYV